VLPYKLKFWHLSGTALIGKKRAGSFSFHFFDVFFIIIPVPFPFPLSVSHAL